MYIVKYTDTSEEQKEITSMNHLTTYNRVIAFIFHDLSSFQGIIFFL